MTNPQRTRHLLEVIRSLPDADRRWLLGQDSGELGSDGLAQMVLRRPITGSL